MFKRCELTADQVEPTGGIGRRLAAHDRTMRAIKTGPITVALLSLVASRDAPAEPMASGSPRIDQPDTVTLALGGGYSWFESEADGGFNGNAAAFWCPWPHVLAGARLSVQSQMTLGLSDQASVFDVAPLAGIAGGAGRFSASAALGPALTLSTMQHSSLFTGRGDTVSHATIGLAVDAGIGWRTGRFMDLTMRGLANLNEDVSAAGLLLGVQGTYAL